MADVESRYKKPENYVNRELSWLDFDYRILEEARDKSLPLFERLKFLSITASNLDEFFMVRVASLKDMVNAGYTKPDLSGMKPSEQLEKIGEKTHRLVEMQYSTYNRSLIPALKANGLRVISHHEELTEEEGRLVDEYFKENVYPVLYNLERLIALGNVHVHVDLIAGLPYESYELFRRSFDKVYALHADALQLGFLKVLAGTPLSAEV